MVKGLRKSMKKAKTFTSLALALSLVLSGLVPIDAQMVRAEEGDIPEVVEETAPDDIPEEAVSIFDAIMEEIAEEAFDESVEEVAPANESAAAPVADENRVNLARGKAASFSSPASTTYNVNRPVHATDGIINDQNNYSDPGSTIGGPQWMQVDLGAVYKIGEVELFRYWHDNRTYRDTVVMISADPNFALENSYILWNANRNAELQWPNGNGQSGTHTLPAGNDGEYVEASSGKTLSVSREDGANYFEAQYVRVYMNGNNKNVCNHVVELQVYAREESEIIEPKEKFVTPENIEVSGNNIALHKEATYSAAASTSYNVNRPAHATDGIINDQHNYADPGGNTGGAHWMQIDLEDNYDIQFVKLYRYWRDNRVYNDTVILVSSEADFAADKTIVLWNANREERTWTRDNFVMPKGSQKNYIETANGLALAVNSDSTTWLDGQERDIPETGFAGRYVRVYMNGNYSVDSNNDVTEERPQNHVVELEVYGTEHSDSFVPSSKVDDRWDFKTKETPLVDLAKYVTYDGNNYSLSDESAELTRPRSLTDGDKYYINNISNNKDPYVEHDRGAVAPEGTEWVQVDLGKSYPIEVINLKRKIYKEGHTSSNGKGRNANDLINYDKTIILASENEDMSNAYVVHYNAPANDNTELPEGVVKPAGATSVAYQETMGGDWYYMDNTNNNGKGYTEIGTVKNARYIRIYSRDNVSEGETLMNLSVYGYRNESDVQEYSKRRVIDNAHPMFFEAAYCSDIYTTYQKDPAQLQGWNTIAGRWNTIDDDLKDYTVLSMHLNNLYPYSNHNVGQSGLQDYYENCLQQAYEVGEGIPTALMLINASDVPNVSETAPGSAVDYNPTKDVDMQWVDLMFRMYPNMQGVFSTESFWSGAHGEVAEATAKMLRIADSHGGFLLWSEANHNNIINNVSSNANYRKAIEDCGQSLFATYKNTRGSQDSNATLSMIMGNWLAGYTGGFGILSDTWAWGNSGNGNIYKTHNYGGKPWITNVCMPDALLGMQMLSAYLEGGTVYTFEWETVIGANDTKAPSYDHVIEEVLRYIVKHPAPTRKEVLDRTKFMVYNEPSAAIYENTVGPNNVMSLYSTSRYGAIPCVSTGFGNKDQIRAKMQLTAANEGSACPTLVDNTDPRLSDEEFMKKLYPITYVGDAFADKFNDTWFFYNSSINTDVKQTATVPLEANETARFSTVIDPHAFFMMTESESGQKITINLNNYRVNRDQTIFNPTDEVKKFNLKWDGSSATGQGVCNGKKSVYVFQTYLNVVNAKTIEQVNTTANRKDGFDVDLDGDGRPDPTVKQHSPLDNELRETVFKIDSLTKKPTVKVVSGQQPDTDGIAQYEDPKVVYDESTKTATISINTNGYVDLEITDLEYAVNDKAVKIEDGVKIPDPPSINVALNKRVTASSDPNAANPLSRITDGDVSSAAKFSDPCKDPGGNCYIQIDLEAEYNIYNVELFRYWADSRKYYNTVVMLSNDVNFASGNTRVIWNANNEKAGRGGQALTGGIWSNVPVGGNDSLYTETSKGKKFYVNDEDHAEGYKARYVRIYNNGSTSNASNHFVEVRVNAEGTPEVQTRNLAQGKAITASSNASTGGGYARPLSWAVDGQLNVNNYTDPGAANNPKGGKVYVDIDLGKTQEIYNVELWRYWSGAARQYKDTVVLVSNDANFAPAETYVLWNAAKAGVWDNIQAGKDSLYNETQEGKKFAVSGENTYWLAGNKEKPGDSIEARYVRVMNNGNNINDESHFVEIKVNGIASLTDETAPTKVTNINLKAFTDTTASIGYTPAIDDTGVKTYEVRYKEKGSSEELTVNEKSSRVLLTNLKPGTTYEVTVYAKDYEDNTSEVSDTFEFTTAQKR